MAKKKYTVQKKIIKNAKTLKVRFYSYYQNNAGGSFRKPAEIIIIEAFNYKDANHRLQGIDEMSFDSCDCCGDRWSYKNSWDEKEATIRPLLMDYNGKFVTISTYLQSPKNHYRTVRVYYINGRIEEYEKS